MFRPDRPSRSIMTTKSIALVALLATAGACGGRHAASTFFAATTGVVLVTGLGVAYAGSGGEPDTRPLVGPTLILAGAFGAIALALRLYENDHADRDGPVVPAARNPVVVAYGDLFSAGIDGCSNVVVTQDAPAIYTVTGCSQSIQYTCDSPNPGDGTGCSPPAPAPPRPLSDP
jgi:hypothetical protein